jgi:hypothetical protein
LKEHCAGAQGNAGGYPRFLFPDWKANENQFMHRFMQNDLMLRVRLNRLERAAAG